MKVLSLLQPWATLVTLGIKHTETRSWATSYRGEFLIHASAKWTVQGVKLYWQIKRQYNLPDIEDMPLGCIIGKATIDDVVLAENWKKSELYSAEQELLGNFTNGRKIYLLSNISPLAVTIPAKGKLRLWDFDIEDGKC